MTSIINNNSHPPPPSSSSRPTMSSAARYAFNLKAIRKRDPTIVSIFDTLPHVCVYHFQDNKWSKHGFEGSMFLFERTKYPPYGLYIMNRMGMEDYVHALCPEDDVICKGQFVIIRSYPNFYQDRMSKIRPEATQDCFSPAYLIPNIDQLDIKQKGPCNPIGLWTHNEFVPRMADVMTRLHSYVKRNLPYPNEYRSTLPTPPPDTNGLLITDSTNGQETDNEQEFSDAPSAHSGEMSDIDKLFFRIKPAPTPASPPPAKTTAQNVTLETLFASAGASSVPASTPAPAPPATGLNLLNSIFQSARAEEPKPQIFAPQPSTSPPQVLNQEVISGLLGLPPSRAPSAASTTLSIGGVSHHSSREGDNEDSSGDDYDESSVARQQILGFAGLSTARTNFANRIMGDVTPRPPLPANPSGKVPQLELPSSIEAASSISTVRGANGPTQPPRANRELVPFAPDSELWPYSKQTPRQKAASDDDDEIVELNFEETSVLSNPTAFRQAALQRKKSAISLADANSAPAPVPKEKGKRAKKTKKDRNARAQEEIEKSWDIPAASGHSNDFYSRVSSPSPPPVHQDHAPNYVPPASEMKTPTLTAKASLSTNGIHHFSPPQLKLVNGKNKARTNGHRGEQEIAKEALLSVAPEHPILQGVTSQAAFSQGLLSLISNDPAFVDSLWKDFVARRGF
ncbi:hypothetical protein CVT24_009937 [Panaeolus cyanescens]|uniref:mRNA-decapping enzyme C-terminal domain-containing protein n=1 Tax=Panaeolus cyanescens TaxID=181874 RepID=A0A409VXH5_9AGAR|nr:hypothetical protein CVT24_009937 [Panaeolus cyanescens]